MIVLKEDNGGMLAKFDRIEFSTTMDWDGVLSRINDQETYICTFGNPDSEYNPLFRKHLGHMNNAVVINGTFPSKNAEKKEEFYNTITSFNSDAKVYIRENTHAKILLISPNEVYITSQNVGYSDWFQVTVHIIDSGAFEYYKKVVQDYIDGRFGAETTNEQQYINSLAPENQIISLVDRNQYAQTKIEVQSQIGKLFKMPFWNMKFNNIRERDFIICTYSIPDYDYARNTIIKLIDAKNTVQLLVNSRFDDIALRLYNDIYHKNFTFDSRDDVHAKLVLCSNGSVWIGSHNFGRSGWFESLFEIKRCPEVRSYYAHELSKYLSKDFNIYDYINGGTE